MFKPIDLALISADLFWVKVDKNGPVPEKRPDLGPCWVWTASTFKKRGGYGQFRSKNGRTLRAHIVAWLLTGNEIAPGLELDHLCCVKRCVNPAHLEPVTRKVNIERGTAYESNRRRCAAITKCPNGHDYTPENTYRKPPNGARVCRTCRRDQKRAARQAARLASAALAA